MTAVLPPAALTCADLAFAWPDGTTVLDGLDLTVSSGRTGLVGANGTGKSTLLRLAAGELTPTRGRISTAGAVAYLPQDAFSAGTIADRLGIAAQHRALAALSRGDTAAEHFETLGDDWDVEERAVAALARLGLPVDGVEVLDRPIMTLSGGEAVLTALAGLLVDPAPITLLDEPTNNLDERARALVRAALDAWPGVLVVAGHDRELLEHVDSIVELHGSRARTFGGPFSAYEQARAGEQRAAEQAVRTADAALARERRQLVETQTKLARRERTGATAQREKRVPKIIAHARQRSAQESAGRYRGVHEDRVAVAHQGLAVAEGRVRDDDVIRVDLPATAVPAGRDVLRLGDLTVRGPERIALVGPNGAGKTTLLDALAGRRRHPTGPVVAPLVPFRYLPQRLGILDDERTVLDNVGAGASSATPNQVRARLARFRLRGAQVEQRAGTLSGGERFRVSLACLLLAEPAPQLLLLDEPTNNLDLASVAQLTSALSEYRGALIVVSHDARFRAELGVTRTWVVRDVGLPVEADDGPDGTLG